MIHLPLIGLARWRQVLVGYHFYHRLLPVRELLIEANKSKTPSLHKTMVHLQRPNLYWAVHYNWADHFARTVAGDALIAAVSASGFSFHPDASMQSRVSERRLGPSVNPHYWTTLYPNRFSKNPDLDFYALQLEAPRNRSSDRSI